MKLADTVDLMISKEHEERLYAEYLQLCIRMRDLLTYIAMYKHEENSIWVKQFKAMEEYRLILAQRLPYNEKLDKLLKEV